MSTRAWFNYYGPPSGEWFTPFYGHVDYFPQCTTTGSQICAILGVYTPNIYGQHPKPLSINLQNYITGALALNIAVPVFPNKAYVYVRF